MIRAFGIAALLFVLPAGAAFGQQSKMSFFVTSVGRGKAADFAGLVAADTH